MTARDGCAKFRTHRLPVPSSDMTVAVSGFSVFLSANSGVQGSQIVNVVIPAGQRLSNPFYVQGTFTTTGSLNASNPGLHASTSTVTTLDTAFVFKEATSPQPISMTAGTPVTITVQPAILPLGTPMPAGWSIRGGVSPITINVVSSAPSVVAVDNNPAIFVGGMTTNLISVRPLAAGTARLSLSGSSYNVTTAQSSVDVLVK